MAASVSKFATSKPLRSDLIPLVDVSNLSRDDPDAVTSEMLEALDLGLVPCSLF
jgi:hypothetical protein